MIRVKIICHRSLGINPHQTFIVKNPKKIEFWKALTRGTGYLYTIKIEELK